MLKKPKIYSSAPLLKIICCLVVIATTISCDTIKDSYLGSWDKKGPLPGNRITILAQQRSTKPDIASDNHQIILPPPITNKDWPQTGGYANHAMHHLRLGQALQKKWSISIGSGTSNRG